MRVRIIEQIEPWHWAPDGKIHYPRRCLLCLLQTLGVWLGLIGCEDD